MLNYLDKEKKIAYKFKNYYDPNHNKIKVVHSDGMEELYEYDSKNRVTRYDRLGGAEEDKYFEIYIRDDQNNTLKVINSTGRHIETQFNIVKQPVVVSDSYGNLTKYFYDDIFRCIKIEDNKYNVENFEYDNRGHLIYHNKLPANYEEWYRYRDGYLAEYYDSKGVDIFYKYVNGLKVREYNAITDNCKDFKYNDKGKLIYSIDSKGKEDSYLYDDKGNLIAHEDEYYIREYTYDSDNFLIEYIRKVK